MSASGFHAVAFWGLQVPAGNEPTEAVSDIPGVGVFRITMAAIDPTAKPLKEDEPKRATLKLMRSPLDLDDFMDEDDEEPSDDDDGSDEESKKIGKLSKKLKEKHAKAANKRGRDNAMEVNGKDEDEGDSEDSEDDGEGDDGEYEEFVICTLDPEKQCQQTLDITIGEDEQAYFKVIGNYSISLTGNYVVRGNDIAPNDDYSEDEDSDYDLSPDEDELMNIVGADDSEDELDEVENPRITEIGSDEDVEAANGEEKKGEEKKGEEKKKLSKAEKKSLKRPADIEEEKKEEPKLSKKQLKKLKANNGKAVDASADTPESKKKVQFAKELEKGPTNAKDSKKTPEKPAASSPAKKVVQGIVIDDKKIGTGVAAKNGHKLGMRYIGKLTNGKVFDSNTKGKPFTFRLGKGEVIKGWDIGLAGMQVGGERRITIPPGMAYGKKGTPGIPGNSTLVFDVKLLEIK